MLRNRQSNKNRQTVCNIRQLKYNTIFKVNIRKLKDQNLRYLFYDSDLSNVITFSQRNFVNVLKGCPRHQVLKMPQYMHSLIKSVQFWRNLKL